MSDAFFNRLQAVNIAKELLTMDGGTEGGKVMPSLDDVLKSAAKIDAFVSGKVPLDQIIQSEQKVIVREYDFTDFSYEGFIDYAKLNFIPTASGPKEFQEQSWMKSIFEAMFGERYDKTGVKYQEYNLPRQIGGTTFLTLLFDWLTRHNNQVLLVNRHLNLNSVRGKKYDIILADSLRYHPYFDKAWAALVPCGGKILLINTVEGMGFER